jgi:uncharacterized membrane-anchored protein
MRKRLALLLVATLGVLLVFAATALAHAPGGQGWYGETNDAAITNAMFLVILFFPAVIILFSVIQWWLDRRKHARMDAAKARAVSADWRGGW